MGARLLALTIAIVAVLAIAVALVFAYDGRIVPGVRIAGAEVGALTPSAARDVLVQRLADAHVTIVGDGASVRLDVSEGIAPDVDGAVADAMAIGRTGSMLERTGAIGAALTSRTDLPVHRVIADADRFADTVDLLAASLERAPVDGDVRANADGVIVREPVAGVEIDRAALMSAIVGAEGVAPTVELPLRYIAPALDGDAIADAAAAARNASLPLVLVAGTERTIVDPARMLGILSVTRERGADGDALVVSLSDKGLDSLVADVAAALDGPVRDAELVPGGERLAVTAGRDGVTVDRAAARAAMADAIVGVERTVALPATITHPVLTTVAALRTSDALILAGGYTTYFPINWARATNIAAAARTFDGVVVAPHESFSFWDRIGEVSPRTGYVFAGTIIGGVSSEAIGGGLCQVSTTFFNAVARAGYAIDERHEHSYYIERYPLGLDAAVFAPSTDMRWTNDTDVPALIRASSTDTSVSFWIYSAPLARTVSFSEPTQWNVRWPSPDQPADPGHVPGYVVPGRDTLVTRTVTENGAVLHYDEWYSHYAPVWGGPAR